jgi:hypothetical protein
MLDGGGWRMEDGMWRMKFPFCLEKTCGKLSIAEIFSVSYFIHVVEARFP